MISKFKLYNYLRDISAHILFVLCLHLGRKRNLDFSAEKRSHTHNSFFNENYNYLAFRTVFRLKTCRTDQVSLYKKSLFFDVAENKLRELLKKFQMMHEESNYYTLIGQTNPCCASRERGISSVIHRIGG